MNTNINQLKRQLNIELEYTDDDAILQNFLNIAEESVKQYLGIYALTGYTGYEVDGYTGSTSTLPISIPQGVILLATHFYLNRNVVSFGQGYEIPYSLKWLLDPYKDFIVL